MVESLKNKVISCVSFKLQKKRWEEKKARKPIEVWTHMASSVAGTLEESISTAFSQVPSWIPISGGGSDRSNHFVSATNVE